jgi:hypothetical protein
MMADFTLMFSLMVVDALLIRSTEVVVGVTGKIILDLPHSTNTFLSPALTADTGASDPGMTPPPPAIMYFGR